MATSDGTTITPEAGVANRVLVAVPDYRYIALDALPTVDPHVEGIVWNNAGTPVVSAG